MNIWTVREYISFASPCSIFFPIFGMSLWKTALSRKTTSSKRKILLKAKITRNKILNEIFFALNKDKSEIIKYHTEIKLIASLVLSCNQRAGELKLIGDCQGN